MALSAGGMTPSGQLFVDGVGRHFPTLVSYYGVDDRYFSTIGLRPTDGRDFTPDDREGAPMVTIVSASLARLLAETSGIALGRTIGRGPRDPEATRVVGIVPDVVTSVTTLEPLVMYLPLSQMSPWPRRTIALHASDATAAAIRDALATIRRLDPAITAPLFTTIDDRLRAQMSPQRFTMRVLGGLGAIALLLTLLSAYVLAETTSRARRRELGIRAALGATPRQLVRLVAGTSVRLVVAGAGTGVALVWAAAGLLESLLFRVNPLEASTLAVVVAGMMAIVLAVSIRPAWRAARADVAGVLKEE
jgi:hypothetical protein